MTGVSLAAEDDVGASEDRMSPQSQEKLQDERLALVSGDARVRVEARDLFSVERESV